MSKWREVKGVSNPEDADHETSGGLTCVKDETRPLSQRR